MLKISPPFRLFPASLFIKSLCSPALILYGLYICRPTFALYHNSVAMIHFMIPFILIQAVSYRAGGIVAVAILCYLVYALLKPDRF